MGKPDLYIHAGPPKTATTFLQNSVLGRIQSAKCLTKPKVEVNGREIRFGDLFDFSPGFWRRLEGDPFSIDGKRPETDVIISDEGVFGGLVPPRRWMLGPVSVRDTHRRPDPYFVSCHLRELRKASSDWGYGEVKFLFTTRRQDTKLASSYAQISNRVRRAGQQSFRRWVQYLLHDTIGYNKGGGVKLDYSIWWDEIDQVIGKENILFIPFELLKENSFEFLKRWVNFISPEEADAIANSLSSSDKENDRSISKNKWRVSSPIRRGPNLRPTRIFQAFGLPTSLPARWPDFRRDDEIRLTEIISEEILKVYKKGNKHLDKINENIDLKKYNYY